MALREVLHNKPSSPYGAAPPLHINVLSSNECPKVIAWDFTHDLPQIKMKKTNKVVAITDGHTVTMVTLLEEFADKLANNKNYIIKNYTLKGDAVPFKLFISKNTLIYRSSPVKLVSDGLFEEAQRQLNPPSTLVSLENLRGARGFITVEGQIAQEAIVQAETRTVQVKGIMPKEGEGFAELYLADGNHLDVDYKLWEPLDHLLDEGQVFVEIECKGGWVTKIKPVEAGETRET